MKANVKKPRVEARKLEKRERILQSAAKIFARKGFYNARISEIAKHAGVADGTIYLYFKNKDDILISVFEESVGKIIRSFRDKLKTISDPARQIHEFARMHLMIVKTDPDLASVLLLELRQSNRFIKEYQGTSLSDYLNLISEIIRDGQEHGLFRQDIHPGIAKRMLFGALDEISTLWVLLRNKKYDLEDSAKQITSIFLNGILRDEQRKSTNL